MAQPYELLSIFRVTKGPIKGGRRGSSGSLVESRIYSLIGPMSIDFMGILTVDNIIEIHCLKKAGQVKRRLLSVHANLTSMILKSSPQVSYSMLRIVNFLVMLTSHLDLMPSFDEMIEREVVVVCSSMS